MALSGALWGVKATIRSCLVRTIHILTLRAEGSAHTVLYLEEIAPFVSFSVLNLK